MISLRLPGRASTTDPIGDLTDEPPCTPARPIPSDSVPQAGVRDLAGAGLGSHQRAVALGGSSLRGWGSTTCGLARPADALAAGTCARVRRVRRAVALLYNFGRI
jgi:hypothetical protein